MLVFSSIKDGKEFVSNPENRKTVFLSLIEDIKDALIFDLDYIVVYRYDKENMHHFLYSTTWIKSLTKALEYFESTEEYEICIEVRDLISIIEDYFL